MDDPIDWMAALGPNPRTPVDVLTGLGNRMALHQRLAEILDSGENGSNAAVPSVSSSISNRTEPPLVDAASDVPDEGAVR